MIGAASIQFLVDAGLDAQQIADFVRTLEGEQPRAPSSAAERQRRYRLRKAEQGDDNVTRDVTRDVTQPPLEEKTPHTPIKPNPHLQNPLKGSKGSASNGKRLDPDWKPNPFSAGSKAASVAIERGEAWLAEQFEQFRNHFLAKPGAAGRSVDWQLSWANWVGRAPAFDRSRSPPPSFQRQQPPDFSKIAGNYS